MRLLDLTPQQGAVITQPFTRQENRDLVLCQPVISCIFKLALQRAVPIAVFGWQRASLVARAVLNRGDQTFAQEPTPEMVAAFAAMDGFIEELVEAGVFVAAAGLKPTAQSKRVLFDGRGGAAMIDGPFTETKEVVVGFSIWEVKDMDEALAWAKRIPAAMAVHGSGGFGRVCVARRNGNAA